MLLIITALLEEYEAAVSAGERLGGVRWRENDPDGRTPYLSGEHRGLPVALAWPGRMGGRGIEPITTTLTNLLRPACLAMSGVCAGKPGATTPGDVIVASQTYQYDEGRWVGDEFQPDPEPLPQTRAWIRAAEQFDPATLPSFGAADEETVQLWFLERLHLGQNPRRHAAREQYLPRGAWPVVVQRLEQDGLIEQARQEWRLTEAGAARIERVLAFRADGPDRLPFAVRTAPMASGNAVLKDPEVWDRLALRTRRILGIEMEAATVATVAHDREVPHWLVVKGVMDHADFDKDDRYKGFAATASAEVLFSLSSRLLPVVAPRANGAASGSMPGTVRLQVVRGLIYDWQDLADLLGIPPYDRYRFPAGNEPRALLDWLEVRDRLGELPDALDELGRGRLADLLRGR